MAPPTWADRSLLLTLGPGAADVRRAVGPTAWAVLECLAASADEKPGETMSYQSVRRIAAALDLAKDTVARALRRLADERLVIYVAARLRDGRFGPSRYRLTLPGDLFVGLPISPAPTPTRSKPNRPSPRTRPTQLSLIDEFPPDP